MSQYTNPDTEVTFDVHFTFEISEALEYHSITQLDWENMTEGERYDHLHEYGNHCVQQGDGAYEIVED
jgi:hypothetical protein